MWSQLIVMGTLAMCVTASPLPQQAPASTQPQQYSQEQLIAYLQQQQQLQQQQPQQFARQQPQAAQPQQQQPQTFPVAQPQPQPQLQRQFLPQQQAQQPLLGVAYSSAADASKTSFSGYGISYNF